MKFILNKDKLKIEGALTINSGSFRDYLIDVETDESWDGLSIEAIIAIEKSNEGISRAVINNQVYIDVSKKERYTIGFIGYTIENNVKTYQRSTDLKLIPIVKGAGEIQATNTEEVPTESEWEIYLAQVQEFINNGNEIINQANNLDLDITTDGETSTIIITRKDGTEKRAVVSGAVEGDLDHSKFQNLDYEHAGHIGFQATINDLNIIREGANAGATAVQPKDLVDGLETKQNKLTAGNNITIENDVISATGGSSGGTSNYNDLSNKPKINNVELSGNKSLSDLGIATKTSELTNDSEFVSDSNYTHTDNNYTTTEKDKLASLSKIDSQNKLNSDLVDDTNQTNKFVTIVEKTSWNNKSNFSGNYEDLNNKPTIPSEVTENTVTSWGFTKNIGTITEITMNGESKGTSGVVNLGNVITSHQDISGKLDTSKVKSANSTTIGDVYDVTYINTMLGNIESLLGGI